MVVDGAMESMPLLRTRGALGTDRTLAGEDLVLLIPSKVVLTSLSKIEIRSRHVAGIVVLLHLFVDHMRNLGGAGDGGTDDVLADQLGHKSTVSRHAAQRFDGAFVLRVVVAGFEHFFGGDVVEFTKINTIRGLLRAFLLSVFPAESGLLRVVAIAISQMPFVECVETAVDAVAAFLENFVLVCKIKNSDVSRDLRHMSLLKAVAKGLPVAGFDAGVSVLLSVG